MKRIYIILCSILLAVSITACGKTEISPPTSVEPPLQNVTDIPSAINPPAQTPSLDTALTPPTQEEVLPPSPTPPESKPSPRPPESKPSPTPPESKPTPTPPESKPSPTPPESKPSPTPPESKPTPTPPESTPQPDIEEENIVSNIQIEVGDKVFSATLEKNDSVDSFVQLLQSAPIVIQMSDYSGFEKVGSLGTSLPTNNSQITAQSGDIILYNGNQICVFYGSNSWSYTRIGKIDDLSGWEEALGSGDATLTFSLN